MIHVLQRQLPLRALALAAALLLFAAQTLAVQHVHADAQEPNCVVCATGQHDHPPAAQTLAPLDAVTVDRAAASLARAPPTR